MMLTVTKTYHHHVSAVLDNEKSLSQDSENEDIIFQHKFPDWNKGKLISFVSVVSLGFCPAEDLCIRRSESSRATLWRSPRSLESMNTRSNLSDH